MRVSFIPSVALAITLASPAVYSQFTGISTSRVQSITDSLNNSANKLNLQATVISAANGALSLDINANVNPLFDLTGALASTTATFWQTAYDIEKKLCSLISAVNQQTVASERANLVAGIQAQISSVIKITNTIAATVNSLEDLVGAFTSSELAVLSSTIKAIGVAATAATEPVTALVTGVAALGLTSLTQGVANLQASVNALANTTTSINFVS